MVGMARGAVRHHSSGRLGEATLPDLRIMQPRCVRFKYTVHFVANAAETSQDFLLGAGRFSRVNERPVMTVHLTGKNRAGLIQITANGDDCVNRLVQKFLQVLRAMTGNVNAHLGHDFDGQWMNAAGWI